MKANGNTHVLLLLNAIVKVWMDINKHVCIIQFIYEWQCKGYLVIQYNVDTFIDALVKVDISFSVIGMP